MKRNLYYRQMYQGNTRIDAVGAHYASGIMSWGRMLLEVFIRKNFGERYFSLGKAVIAFVILIVVPFFDRSLGLQHFYSVLWSRYTLWYAFAFAFLYFSILRHREIPFNPSVYDFAKFSLYSGDTHPFFLEFKKADGTSDMRRIETVYEPLGFLAVGICLWLIGQSLGILLFFSAWMYAASYQLLYSQGDQIILDRIDERLMNEEMENIFVFDKDAKDTRGVTMRGRKPATKEMREKVSEMLTDEEIFVAS